MKKFIAIIAAVVLAFAISLTAANANAAQGAKCTPHAAYTETIKHPAVTHVEHTDAVPATAGRWWNFSPNKQKGPFNGPPAFPTDARGTWQGPHTNGGPSKDKVGTFQQGNGHGSWFHREAGTPGTPASNLVVVDKLATVEVILHEAVKCDGKKPVVHKHTSFEPAPVPTVKPRKHVTPTVVEAGY